MTPRPAAAWLVAGLALAAGSCGRARRVPTALSAPTVSPDSERLDAVLGRTIIVPVDRSAPGRKPGVVTLADGTPVAASLVRIAAAVQPEDRALGWSSPAGAWRATPADLIFTGLEAIVINLPAHATGPLVVEGTARPTQWLTPAADTDPKAWAPVRPPDAGEDFAASRWVGGESRSPLTRWRWRLIADGLRPGATTEPFDDPVVEALAVQNEERWRLALAALRSASPEIEARLKRRLSGIVNFGNGVFAPCWAGDAASLDLLLAALLDPGASRARRADAAEGWLRESPPAVAWVFDEGGTLAEPGRAALPTVGLASLLDRDSLAWAGHLGAASPDLRPLPAMSAVTLLVPPEREPPRTDLVEAHVGDWSARLPALLRVTPVVPPGLAVSAFSLDWSMDAWTVGAPRVTRGDWATAALLHRPARPPGSVPTSERSRLWELMVECHVPAGHSIDDEQVRVYVGPLGRAAAALLVRPGGTVTRLPLAWQPPGTAELAGGPTSAVVTRRPDAWTFRIPLPPGAVEKDGVLRLGLVRTDARGQRSAWPRAMLPWQDEPGRAALDTSAWTSVTQAPE